MVINQQMATVPQSDGIRTAVAVGQFHKADRAPRPTVVLRPRFEQMTFLSPSKGLKSMAGMDQDAGLDGVDRSAIINRSNALPAFATVHGPFKMNLPRIPKRRAEFGAA